MKRKLELKIRELKGKEFIGYFKNLVTILCSEYIENMHFSIEIGDKILSQEFLNNSNVLIPMDKYFGFNSINELTDKFNEKNNLYFFGDCFEFIGPYLINTKVIFDNLILVLKKTNDKTIIVVSRDLKINCLINLIEQDTIIDIKMYWN